MDLRSGGPRPGMGAFLQVLEWREPFSIGDVKHTSATLVEDGKAVLVRTFCGKVTTLAKSADDLSSTSGLGELLANFLFL